MRLLLFTGFLGSGKTTLVIRLARFAVEHGQKVAILVNEIGEVGIDNQLMRRLDLNVWELLGGCICCTLSADLVSTLQELPAKKCLLNPDGMTNMRQFKQLAGDRMAMVGDVPASMLAAGTPEDVPKHVRGLIELFEGKGLILCVGCDAPINTKPENMQALVEAAHEYGRM
jgi:uroporphyrinogen-III decarboxylase